jgi:alkanesulfonate monooxygenase SsuD/methylene tetrahydromethanopterin reductase-like flavin-dependent oxidoreductase (luciferase family)
MGNDDLGPGSPGRLRLSGPGISAEGITATVRDVRDAAVAADVAGFDYFSYGDTVWREIYAVLGMCADATSHVALGPSVTNPSTRNPVVTAAGIASIDELSQGRAFLGIGMGQSANAIAGVVQASADELRRAIVIISSAQRRAREFEEWPDGVEIDESVAELQWVKRRVPILVAAGFRQGLQIAAELADGVMLRAGDVDWAGLPDRIRQLHAWRAAGPRAGQPFEIQLLLFSQLTDSVEAGRRALGGLVSARANTSTREHQLPAELVEPWKRFRDQYDYRHHASLDHPVNVRLMEDLGLADYFFDRYCFVGDEDALLDKLAEIERIGVTATTIGGPWERAIGVIRRYREQRPNEGPPSPLRPRPPGMS